MRSVEVVEIRLMERLAIDQFPGWSGGKARLDMLGRSATGLAGREHVPQGGDDVG